MINAYRNALWDCWRLTLHVATHWRTDKNLRNGHWSGWPHSGSSVLRSLKPAMCSIIIILALQVWRFRSYSDEKHWNCRFRPPRCHLKPLLQRTLDNTDIRIACISRNSSLWPAFYRWQSGLASVISMIFIGYRPISDFFNSEKIGQSDSFDCENSLKF